jgi:capsid protein
MPTAPIKINERRSSHGYNNTNTLIEAATQRPARKRIFMQDKDTSRAISSYGRRTLMTLGRWLFWNIPHARAAILEQANLSVSTFIPQFYGADENIEWGREAESWLTEWDKICDVQGWPYDGNTLRRFLVIQPLVDGEVFILLTQNQDGFPLIQVHPAHRIGSAAGEKEVVGGQFGGYRICDGVITNEFGRAIAYRYIGDNYDPTNYQDIPATNLFPVFDPEFSDLYRGLSGMASCIFDFQDIQETRGFEKLAQKIAATISLIEKNETGEADSAKAIVQAGTVLRDEETGDLGSLSQETLDGGMIRYLRAGSGASIESLTVDRPTAAQQSFEDRVMQSAMAGMEWSKDFSLDPSKVGGAQMRVVVDKINRVIAKRQQLVAKVMRRIHGYAIAKSGLPQNPEWFKFQYQGPAELTADKKYQSDVDLQEHRAGFVPLDDICGRRAGFWEKTQDQLVRERARLERICRAQTPPIDPDKISMPFPNPPAPAQDKADPNDKTA